MKYISTLIFAVALAYTWNLAQQEQPISFQTHAALQLKLGDVIQQSVREIKPSATAIEIINITTQPISDEKIKAYFSYRFQEPDAETGEVMIQQINGEAILHRTKQFDNSQDLWTMDNVQTNTGAMEFKSGIVITPGSEQDDMPSGEEVAPENNANPAAPIEPSASEQNQDGSMPPTTPTSNTEATHE